MPSVPSGSSIPSGLVRDLRAVPTFGPGSTVRAVAVDDLPKLYAHWAEGAAKRIELRLRSTTGLHDWSEDEVELLVERLSAALGLEDRA